MLPTGPFGHWTVAGTGSPAIVSGQSKKPSDNRVVTAVQGSTSGVGVGVAPSDVGVGVAPIDVGVGVAPSDVGVGVASSAVRVASILLVEMIDDGVGVTSKEVGVVICNEVEGTAVVLGKTVCIRMCACA